jgi:broad specificity phosphatase PhoE
MYASFMGDIFLIRHGQASFGSTNYDELSEIGLLQARILGNFLIKVGIEPNAVYSGSLMRQTTTAGEVASVYSLADLDFPYLRIEKAFNEYDAQEIIRAALSFDSSLSEELSKNSHETNFFKKIFGNAMQHWVTGMLDSHGIESWIDLRKRVYEGLMQIIRIHGRSKTILIFTSGGVISAGLAFLLGFDGVTAMRINSQIVNTSITHLVYNHERITLSGFNSRAHLMLESNPGLITYW